MTDLYKVFPQEVPKKNIDMYGDEILAACDEFGINTKLRKAAFFSQILHESGSLNFVRENLNYKAESLRRVFSKYFPNDTVASQYERNPEKIANKVYANRMGNGDEASGDGWKYRGRGFIQITGKYNYETCGAGLGEDLNENPSYLETPIGAARSAAWYWDHKDLNKYADKGDNKTITKLINGGFNGLDDRTRLYEILMKNMRD